MDLLPFLRAQVRANRLANHRLHAAMAPLGDEAFHARRTGFFPSLAGTLNHILWVDQFYLGCLAGEVGIRERCLAFVPRDSLPQLAADQAQADEQFIALMQACSAADLDRVVEMPRARHVQREPLARVVAHLLNHQVHHRGQAHAMLSSTPVAPPQLDEFLMASEAHLRRADLEALGWSEADIFGPPATDS
jgi:uncharacterized damage-inducible protein DinB